MRSWRFHHGARVRHVAVGRVIVDGKPAAGVCTFDRRGLSRVAQAEIYLAGPVAERLMDPARWNADDVVSDYAQAAALLGDNDIKAAVERVRLWLGNHLAQLLRLGAALIEHGELTETEIVAVLARRS